MKRLCFFIFSLVCLFSSFSCKNDEVIIEIKSTLVKNGKLFNTVEFQNNTNSKLYFPDGADLQSRWRGFAIRACNTSIVIKKFFFIKST